VDLSELRWFTVIFQKLFSLAYVKLWWATGILTYSLWFWYIHCDTKHKLTQPLSPSRRNCLVVWVCVCLSVTIEFLGVRKMFGGTYLVQFIRTKLLGVRKMFFVRVFARVMFSELRLYRKKSNHFPFFIFNTQSQSLHQNLHFHFHWKANPS
jgi:hypothetical protein